jgi:hypothetical protein
MLPLIVGGKPRRLRRENNTAANPVSTRQLEFGNLSE